ncbi:MAG TPA: hypothetical protein VK697_11935 [Methylomirabilota bacterium]|nr:hypothetical protein [Methylomirabilota bacterium]
MSAISPTPTRRATPAGSQLAETSLERGDRIVAVDGELLHANPEISERCAVIRLASR